MNLRKKILRIVRDENLTYLPKKETAQRLNKSMDDIKKALDLLQDDDFLEVESFTMAKWKVRITARGCRVLEGKIK